MKGETKLKREFERHILNVWRCGNRLYKTRLNYPQIRWFHQKENTPIEKQDAGYALSWREIYFCFEYLVFYKEEMEAVGIHEVAHCFADYRNYKNCRGENVHGRVWRDTATRLAREFNCLLPVANHAYHTMELSNEQIRYCKPKRRK